MEYELHVGDCLGVMAGMDANSIDAIVTDPPYGLQFMGKEWDHGVPGEAFWIEALRVAKPGAWMLAFGGTRTWHRLAVAIEDAGWEIRDTIAWVYGQGFPKSHNVSKAIDKMLGAEREVIAGKWNGRGKGIDGNTFKHNTGSVERTDSLPATPEAKQWDGFGTALKPSHESIIVAQKPIDDITEHGIIVANLYKLEVQLWLLSNANIVEKSLGLSQREYAEALDFAQWTAEELRNIQDVLLDQMDMSQYELATNTILNIVSSWRIIWEEALKHGNTFITETVISPIIDLRILSCSVSALMLQDIVLAEMNQPGSWLNVLPAAIVLHAASKKLSATLELIAVESAINEGRISRQDAVDQTVLYKPIVVARKPLIGTVAANVLEWGTGAINIDGCRVGTERTVTTIKDLSQAHGNQFGKSGIEYPKIGEFVNPPGRWPANFIHDGSDEVLALMPESKSTGGDGYKNSVFCGGKKTGGHGLGDSGSAARFYYCAKASKRDRDEGLEDMTNTHATVKPTDLMRYLCRLVTPPGGKVLDPFMGSGSTGKAAMFEGFNFVGIELDADNVEIARRRIEYARKQPRLV